MVDSPMQPRAEIPEGEEIAIAERERESSAKKVAISDAMSEDSKSSKAFHEYTQPQHLNHLRFEQYSKNHFS